MNSPTVSLEENRWCGDERWKFSWENNCIIEAFQVFSVASISFEYREGRREENLKIDCVAEKRRREVSSAWQAAPNKGSSQ